MLGRLALALVMLALFASPASAAEKGVVPDLTWGTSSTEQRRTTDAIADLGAQWVRLNVSWYWTDLYPAKLPAIERAVDRSRAAGARVVIMFNHAPTWASGSTNPDAPPLSAEPYGKALGTLANRLKGKVAGYEIWNEPNHPQFWPTTTGPDPAAYGELLKAGSRAVRAADPAAKVLFGGLAFNDYDFLEQAYQAHSDLGSYYDVMAVHPYPMPFNQAPESVERAADGRISPYSFSGYREIRAFHEARGDAKPIWFTEFGWSTTANPTQGVSEATQADYLTRAFEFVEQDPYVEVAITYSLRNNYTVTADTWESRLGMMNVDFTRKAAYAAFKAYTPPGGTTAAASSTTKGPGAVPQKVSAAS